MKILCVCLSSTIQRTLKFEEFKPCQVNRSSFFIENASGKAINTARVLNQLEKDCAKVVCPVGKENKADFFKLAKKDGIKIDYVLIPGKTRSCWTLLGKNGETTEVVCDEPKQNFTEKEISKIETQLLRKIKSNLVKTDAVILAGSTPKHFSQDLCAKISKAVKTLGKLLLVDYTGIQLTNTLNTVSPDFIKINKEEFLSTFSEGKEFIENLKQISGKYKTTLVITDGTNPTICCHNKNIYKAETTKVTAVNTTACGDSFNAGFIYSILSGSNLEDALNHGSKTAGLNAASLIPGSIQ